MNLSKLQIKEHCELTQIAKNLRKITQDKKRPTGQKATLRFKSEKGKTLRTSGPAALLFKNYVSRVLVFIVIKDVIVFFR